MSNLKFEITFVHQVTGAKQTVVVDLQEFSAYELNDVWNGPGKYTGPLARAYAFAHAARRVSSDFMGMPGSVTAHRVN